jgi:hypothetical protein
MRSPEQQHLLKRRLQILDDETRDGRPFNACAREDGWVENFTARLADLIRKIGDRK